MALGAVLGAALTTPTTLSYTLTLNGVSVLRQPGTGTGALYGTLLGSVAVKEAGVGGVSSMEFVVDDPANALDVADGATVVYWDHFNDKCVFYGWVDTSTKTELSVLGKQVSVKAVGREAVLDWGILPADVTFAAGANAADAIFTLVAAATGQGYVDPAANGDGMAMSTASVFPSAVTVTAGTSLREAIRQVIAQGLPAVKVLVSQIINYVGHVDFMGNLRTMEYRTDTTNPGPGYRKMRVGPGQQTPTDLQVTRNASQVRGVYIKGGNAAGSGVVMDGTGMPGAINLLEDPTITTQAARDAAAIAYLAQYAGQVTGSVVVQDQAWNVTGGTPVRGGSWVEVIDPILAPSPGVTAQIGEIDKRFGDAVAAGTGAPLETWTVTFGALPPSLAALLRNLSDSRTV